MNNSNNTNKLVVPGAKQAIERMKYEIEKMVEIQKKSCKTKRFAI